MPAPERVDEARRVHANIPTNFSWVVPGKIAGMGQPTSARQLLRLHHQLGVGVVLNLTPRDLHQDELRALGGDSNTLRMLHLPLPDYAAPSAVQLALVVAEMRKAIADNQAVAVHCCGGLGRTGMVIACYLVAEEGFRAHEAISLVREKRPHSLVCPKQELAVHRFEAHLDELARH